MKPRSKRPITCEKSNDSSVEKPKPSRNVLPHRPRVCMIYPSGYVHATVKSRRRKVAKRTINRSTEKKVVRDQIISMLMKANWVIQRMPRIESSYEPQVYIDRKGRKHWSITNAYHALKKAIEDGEAHCDEICAFTPIPESEMCKLYRTVTKVRSDKNVKRNKGPGNDSSVGWTTESSSFEVQSLQVNRDSGGSIEPLSPRTTEIESLFYRKRNLLTWIIDSGVIPDRTKLSYWKSVQKEMCFEGVITANGVICTKCNETMGLSQFISHVGGDVGEIFKNTHLGSRLSFYDCLVASWRKVASKITLYHFIDATGDNFTNDTCDICGGDHGALISCDGCPSTFHQSCLQAQNWHCVYCLCKYCSRTKRCGCISNELFACALCDGKFHKECTQVDGEIIDSGDLSFCGEMCRTFYKMMKGLLGVKMGFGDRYSFTLLKHFDDTDPLKIACNSKLALAMLVMNECFLPIIDSRSQVDMIPNVVYNCGSNFKRLNCGGFFTLIMEKDDEVISVASIRVHGNKLAEMPFIGTRYMYRRQGMCRRLLESVEYILCHLGVKKLVIPAISDLVETWTKVFGFKPLEESTREIMKSMSIVLFPGAHMLQKNVPKYKPTKRILNEV